jgi:hypothetical protein
MMVGSMSTGLGKAGRSGARVTGCGLAFLDLLVRDLLQTQGDSPHMRHVSLLRDRLTLVHLAIKDVPLVTPPQSCALATRTGE